MILRQATSVLVLAPLGRDGGLIQDTLGTMGIEAHACASMNELVAKLPESGCAVVTIEAFTRPAQIILREALRAQPPWSDFPLLILGPVGEKATEMHLGLVSSLGNASLLDRPVSVRALVSAAQAALRARRRQYEACAAIEQRDQFLAMLGHELRNPLAAITLAVDGIEHCTEDTRVRKYAGMLDRQAKHLSRLVDDLLDVSRVTSGRIALAKKPFDLAELLSRCVQTYLSQAADAGVALTFSAPREKPTIDADIVRVEQVFSNLIGNAIKYTPRGGCIGVTADIVGDDVIVDVKDTGLGVAPEMLTKIFELFTQVPGSLDRARGGLGVGLTLVRRLVDLHGGRVSASSTGLGQGSTFTVRLPRMQGEFVAPIPLTPRRAVSTRVVVIDDSDDVRASLKDVLELLGHHVDTAKDGPSGLALLLEEKPAVALVDIGLPGIDGYEVARRARAVLGNSVRLIAISGYGQPRDKANAKQAGFDAHVTKPVEALALEEIFAPAP